MREKMKSEVAQLQQSAVHNHTAAMLEMGTNLLSQTAEQTRKLTDVEAQVSPYWMQKLSADLYKRVIIYIYFSPMTGSEPNIPARDPAAGKLSFHQ